MGRPSLKTPELIEAICKRIADGEGLRAICRSDDMPGRQTVLDWLEEDADFRAKYARAREAQGDLMDEMIMDEAAAADPASAALARVRIDAYKWRAAKLRPKVYGDSVTYKGDKDAPLVVKQQLDVTTLPDDALAAAKVLAEALHGKPAA